MRQDGSAPDARTSHALAGMLAVPVLSASTMGRFRALFGVLLFIAVMNDPPHAQPGELHRNYSWLADWSWVHLVASSAEACRVLHAISLALIVLFTVGLWTRAAYVGLIVGVFASRLVRLQSSGTHDWDLPLLTLLALTVIPWADGFSLDAHARRRSAAEESHAGQLYGLAVWLPGLMLGLSLMAAAYAKLTNGGLAWVTSGAVKYHFVEDAANAPLTWGLWVAASPVASVLLSFGAVLIEGGFICNVFLRSVWSRLAMGILGLSLFGGMFVFQGVLWFPWLILFSVFLPWQMLDREKVVLSERGQLRPWHIVLVAVLVLQQVLASVTATQIEPLISDYPMYSLTYDSPEAFERIRYRKMQRLLFESGGRNITENVYAIANAPENLLNVAEDLAVGDPLDGKSVKMLGRLREQYKKLFGADIDSVAVTAERVGFDWQRGSFKPPSRVAIAEVPLTKLDSLR